MQKRLDDGTWVETLVLVDAHTGDPLTFGSSGPVGTGDASAANQSYTINAMVR